MSNPAEPWRGSSSAPMTGCRVAGWTLGALVLGLVLMNIPDLLRYIKIRNM